MKEEKIANNTANPKESEEKKKKRRKIFFLWFFIIFSVALISAGGVVAGVMIGRKNNEDRMNEASILALSVSAYKVGGENKKLFEDKYYYDHVNFGIPQNATAINETISPTTSVKLVYNMKNIKSNMYYYTIDFSEINQQNCQVSYVINSNAELEVVGNIINYSSSTDATIEVLIKVDNPANDSHFIGYVSMFIAEA